MQGIGLGLVVRLAAKESGKHSVLMRLKTGDASGRGGLTSEGAFDPRTDTGYLRTPQDDSVGVVLLINGTKYEGAERPEGKLPADKGPGETYGRYGQYPGKYDRLSVSGDPNSALGAAAPDPAALFKALRDKLDPNKSNGGVLLGLKGVVVKSHGGINAEGFAYAVDVGYEMVRCDLLTKISALVQAQIAQEVVS